MMPKRSLVSFFKKFFLKSFFKKIHDSKKDITKSTYQRTATSEEYLSIEESPPKEVTLPGSHPVTEEINRIAMEQLKYAQAGVQDKVRTLLMFIFY